ncbi:MAG: MFS transporter [Verrucomicrobia bacterium]|nr:MFS transporter [Verrucomicrobiota bacterium]MBV8640093.1 MFS transporter [Verrucomicrobiota bacterium]
MQKNSCSRPDKESPAPAKRSWLVAFLGFAAGATVANIYYAQPLLHAISTHFHSNATATGVVSVATQLGFGSGLLVLVPLGDSLERRTLIVGSMIGTALMLLAVALSSTLPLLILVSYLLGLICITPQLIVPYAAGIAAPESRGRTVGAVMSGLLIGILFSRSASGFIGARAGWQTVYLIAAAAMLLLAVLSALVLLPQRPERRIPYRELLGSLWPILKSEPVVQRHAIIGALGFAAFSAFWTTLAFYLAGRPEHFDSQTTGLFGLVGVAGAIAAPLSGRLSDRYEARIVNGSALALMFLSFILMGFAHYSLAWLVSGVFLMDAGAQASQISNQTRIYALAPALRNRINAVYMVCFFFGGAIGSALGSLAWAQWGWTGVCATGATLAAAGIAFLFGLHPTRPSRNQKRGP